MNTIDVMKQALEALEVEHSAIYGAEKTTQAITNLRAAIAEIEKAQPVAWKDKTYGNLHHHHYGTPDRYIPLYPAPAVPEGEK